MWTFRCVFWVLITWPVCWCPAVNLEVFVCTYRLLSPVVWGPQNDHDCTLAVQSPLSLPATLESTELACNKLNAITHNLNLSRFLPCCSWRTMLRVCQLPSGWIFHLRLGCQTFFISSFLHTWFHSSTLRSFQIASSNIIFVAEETYVKRQHFRPSRKKRTLYHLFWPPKKTPLLRGQCVFEIFETP